MARRDNGIWDDNCCCCCCTLDDDVSPRFTDPVHVPKCGNVTNGHRVIVVEDDDEEEEDEDTTV
jgi:hypothetical protein